MITRLIPVIRDLVCLCLGSFGFVWQVTHGAELVLMAGSIIILSGPAVMAAWSLGRAGGSTTTGSSLSSPSSSPLPPPSSLSSSAGSQ